MTDQIRYVLAVAVWVSVPQAVLWWFIVHPFVGFWRRVGKVGTFTVLGLFYVAAGVGLFFVRDGVLAVEYGTNRALWVPAIALYLLAAWIQVRIRKQLKFSIMAGAPELEADGKGGELLDQGLYARMRHPRYVAVLVGMMSWAFFTNYLAVYVMVPLLALALAVIAVLEERELVERFGEAYERYRARTPMFIPRLGSG